MNCALGIRPRMEMRHMKITEGARIWVQTPTGALAAPGWENGHEATAIRINREGLIPMITAPGGYGAGDEFPALRIARRIRILARGVGSRRVICAYLIGFNLGSGRDLSDRSAGLWTGTT